MSLHLFEIETVLYCYCLLLLVHV